MAGKRVSSYLRRSHSFAPTGQDYIQENGEGVGRGVSVAAMTLKAEARVPVPGLSSKESKFLESFYGRKRTELTIKQ